VFAIGAGGALAPVTCDPLTVCKTGANPQAIAVDPSGSHVYAVNSASVSVFSIAAGGVLAPVACDAATLCQTGGGSKGAAVDPSGGHFYVSSFGSGHVTMFSIGAGGALAPIACTPATSCQSGPNSEIFSLAVSPDRGPVAAFSAGAGTAGSASQLDASAASSPDYPIASYVWDFGDGQTQTSALPAVQHTYATSGSYAVALRVADQAGCSTAVVFTGQTVSCNGSAKARAVQTVVVPPAPAPVPVIAAVSKLALSPSTFRAGPRGASAVAAAKRYGGKVTFGLNVAASVRFTVQRRNDGRKVKHGKKTSCDRSTKRNRANKTCTRHVTLKGSFTRAGLAGTNRFRFTGRLNGKRLAPGRYLLVATATKGRSATANFRVIR
jgi:hypothetical protein